MHTTSSRLLAPLAAAAACLALAIAGIAAEPKSAVAPDKAAADPLQINFKIEHEIGHRVQIDPNDLPAPKTGPIVTDRSLTLPYTGQVPAVPPGFTATPFAVGLANPRRLLVLPNGDVLVAEQSVGYLTLLRDGGDGRAQWIDRHVEDLNKPYGLAWRGDELLVTDQDAMWRVPHVVGALRAGRPAPAQKAADVPPEQRKPVDGAYGAQPLTKKGVFGIVAGHQNRDLKVDPKTGALLVADDTNGTIWRIAYTGKN
jgi:glucose/arabinose dehydrogenase